MKRFMFLVIALAAVGCTSMEKKYGTAWLQKYDPATGKGVVATNIGGDAPLAYIHETIGKAAGCPGTTNFGKQERKTSQRIATIPWTQGGNMIPLTQQVTDVWTEVDFVCTPDKAP